MSVSLPAGDHLRSSPTSSSSPPAVKGERTSTTQRRRLEVGDEGRSTTIQQEEAASTRGPASAPAGPPPPLPVDSRASAPAGPPPPLPASAPAGSSSAYLSSSSSMSAAKEAQSIAVPTIAQESSSKDEGHQAMTKVQQEQTTGRPPASAFGVSPPLPAAPADEGHDQAKVQQEQTSGKKPASAFGVSPPLPAAPPPPLSPLSSSGERSPQESSAADDVHQADGASARKADGASASGAPPPVVAEGGPQSASASGERSPAQNSTTPALFASVLPIPKPDPRAVFYKSNTTAWAAFGSLMSHLAHPLYPFNAVLTTKVEVWRVDCVKQVRARQMIRKKSPNPLRRTFGCINC